MFIFLSKHIFKYVNILPYCIDFKGFMCQINFVILYENLQTMKSITVLTLFLILAFNSFAQEVIATAGETFENDEISISWTLGETIIATFEAGDIVLTQGFHQDTYEITSIKEQYESEINISIFPNPANEEFFIKYDGADFDRYFINIYSIDGNLIDEKDLVDELTGIDITNLQSGEYIISVTDQEKKYRSYKLIKY